MAAVKVVLLLVLTFLSFINAKDASKYVPVLFLGSDSDRIPPDPASALQRLSSKEFTDDYFGHLKNKGPIIIALQDKLSMEDFSLFGNSYGGQNQRSTFANLQNALNDQPFLLLPSVEVPSKAFTSFNEDLKLVEINADKADYKIDQLSLTSAVGGELGPNVIVLIHLPKTTTVSSEREKTLKTSDEYIKKICDELKSLKTPFTFLYTGSEASWAGGDEEDEQAIISRHLLADAGADESGCPLIDTNQQVLFYVKEIRVLNESNEIASLGCSNFSISAENDTTTDTVQVTLKLTASSSSVSSLVMTFNFSSLRGFWATSFVAVNLTTDKGNFKDAKLSKRELLTAPLGFSYTCENARYIGSDFSLEFVNLQMQTYLMKGAKFGDPMDCVGFFSIPIWMSIFVTIILILVLAFGIQMVLNINTMDRFDDPKGKTIAIPSND